MDLMEAVPVVPVLNNAVRGLCLKPYHGHKKGCPNYGKADRCPPNAKLLWDIIDKDKPVLCVYNKFPFGEHVAKMKKLHPEWSQKQCECCLYWQGTARKQLKEKIKRAVDGRGLFGNTLEILTTPEACGVDVTATMKRIGIDLEWPPKKFTYQVAIIGYMK